MTEPTAPPPPGKRKRRFPTVILTGAAVAVLVLGAGGFFLFKKLNPPPPPPPPVVAKPKPSGVPATPQPAVKPAVAASASLTPSETLNALAHAPVNAINKAQDAVNARRAGEQARVDASVNAEEPPDKKAGDGKTAAPAKLVETSSPIAPGVSATNSNIEAVSEATPAFRLFVANAKIVGVIQSDPPRAVINNRLTRTGDIVDTALGITFDGIDAEKRQIIFKDKSGATVTRRY
jgi:cytoskeletal protein RodZ